MQFSFWILPTVFTVIAAFFIGRLVAFTFSLSFIAFFIHAFYPYNSFTNLKVNLEQSQIELSGTIFTNPYAMKLKVSNIVKVIILKVNPSVFARTLPHPYRLCFVYGVNNYFLTTEFYNREENEKHPIAVFVKFWEKNYSSIPILRRDWEKFSHEFPNYVHVVNFTNLSEDIGVSQAGESFPGALVTRKIIAIRYLAFPLALLFTWFIVVFYIPWMRMLFL